MTGFTHEDARDTTSHRLRVIRDAYVRGSISFDDFDTLTDAALADDRDTMARSCLAAQLVGYAISATRNVEAICPGPPNCSCGRKAGQSHDGPISGH